MRQGDGGRGMFVKGKGREVGEEMRGGDCDDVSSSRGINSYINVVSPRWPSDQEH